MTAQNLQINEHLFMQMKRNKRKNLKYSKFLEGRVTETFETLAIRLTSTRYYYRKLLSQNRCEDMNFYKFLS
jgi:hypothetical protein